MLARTSLLRASLALCLLSALACGGDKDKEKTQSESATSSETGKKGKEKGKAKKAPSQRVSMTSWRPLLSEAMRAELRVNGLAIDFGSTDQHKYTRGGWATGWKESGKEAGSNFGRTRKGVARINFWLQSEAKEIVFRARLADGASEGSLGIARGKTSFGEALNLSNEWKTYRVAVPADALPLGKRQIQLKTTAEVDMDWMWIANTSDAGEYSNLPRTLPIKFANGSRRSLAAPSSRSFSFYLHPPKDSKLIFDIASDKGANFKVSVLGESGSEEELFAKKANAEWSEAVVDLGKYAGQAIRLQLSTDSEMGKTGWGEPEIMIPKLQSSDKADTKAQNLVYVVMDTTRADSFASVNPDTTVETPHYDALAKKATTFKNAYNNENWTKPSVTTMWSSLYPGTHGARQATSKVDKDIYFLPQALEKAGFQTGAFIANAVVSETFGFKKGWTHFQNDSDHNLNGNGSKLYPNAAKWMEEHKDERFFLYVQSVDPHTTYEVPKDYWSKYYKGSYKGQLGTAFDREEQIVVDNGKMKVSQDDVDWIWALYNGEVTYQDHYLGGLLAKIEELGLSENTLVVITNDHGEEIKDHGAMGHGWPLFEEQIRAPLMMRYPGLLPEGKNVETVVEHVDLAPTILDILGVPPMKSAEGLSFLPMVKDGVGLQQKPFYSLAWSRKAMRSVRVGDWKLIVGKSSDWMHLYNLADDPGEKKNLLKKGKAPEGKALLAARLCEIYLSEALATPNKAKRMEGTSQKQEYNSHEIPVDEKTRKELEALGYL